MNVLSFDTSGSFLSTALKTDSGFFVNNRDSGLRHSEHLLKSLEYLLSSANIEYKDIDLVVCVKGPGSFTGLRIGMATAKGISTGSGCPYVSINSLDLFANNLDFFDGAVVPLIDARKKRFYSAIYVSGTKQSDYLDISAEDLLEKLEGYENVLFCGSGVSVFKDKYSSLLSETSFTNHFYNNENVISSSLVSLGTKIFEETGADPDNSGPFYIRLSDAELAKL